uniref:PAN domain protein n=1 Tax=Panagrellus redivivus TaxID=6233 RepID=A0A7E4UZ71_PANRE
MRINGVASVCLVFILYCVTFCNSATFATQCFLPTYHRGISNAVATAELWNVSPYDCLTYCIVNAGKTGDGCAAVVYHRRFSTCQLYGHDGTFHDAKVVFAMGHDYYNRTKFDGICQDRHPPARGYPQRKEFAAKTVQVKQPVQEPLGTGFAQPGEPKSYNLYPNEPTGECTRSQSMGYFVLRDYQLTPTTPTDKTVSVDRFECLNYCAQNRNSRGDYSRCVLISYDAATEECQLHDESAKEAALFTRVEPKRFNVVAEKFCFNRNVRCGDDVHLKVLVGKTLHASPLHVIDNVDTLADCTKSCLGRAACKVVVMSGNTCQLYTNSLATDGDLIRDGGSSNTVMVDVSC